MKSNSSILDHISCLFFIFNMRDFITAQHQKRVGLIIKLLGIKLELTEDEINMNKLAAYLHDIGKIGVPETILFKYDRLSDAEFKIIQKHPGWSSEIVKMLKLPEYTEEISQIVLCHHEYLDGSGYPNGIKDIPFGAQMITIVDIFDSLSNQRQYKKRMKFSLIIELLEEESKTRINPDILSAFKKINLLDLLKILEPNNASSKEDCNFLKRYCINDLKGKKVDKTFEKYYEKRYLTLKSNNILAKYLKDHNVKIPGTE